jgi:hypothetical protein
MLTSPEPKAKPAPGPLPALGARVIISGIPPAHGENAAVAPWKPMMASPPMETARKKPWGPVVVVVLTAVGVAGAMAWWKADDSVAARKADRPSPVQDEAPAAPPGPIQLASLAPYGRAFLDNSGFLATRDYLAPQFKDPLSLAHVREVYDHVGMRGIAEINALLARGDAPPEVRLNLLQNKVLFYNYEGEFAKAAEVLAELRRLVESDPRFHPALPTLIFLQGITALRLGETENCVECQCQGSCIFPIAPQAVHQRRKGSTEAIKHFTEYLEIDPKDIEARWLLNLAYMTLGEHPAGVPEKYRIPLEPFQSKLDIGRFMDVAPRLGVNRLDMAGGAIMDDFDNDGLLDLMETTSDPTQPMAFYRNKGDGTFEDRTKAAGLEKQYGGLYCAQTDYNNDGFLDVLVCRGAWWGVSVRPSLLRNNGNGTFTDVSKEAGIWNASVGGQVAVWADYDNDGYLDLFLGNENGRSYLYHNRGDGTFEEVAEKAGVANDEPLILDGQPMPHMCKGANWCDFNRDGYPDLVVNNFNGPPRLYRNNKDGTFTDVARELGITKPAQNGFSCWFFDYDNDGWPDLFLTCYERGLGNLVKAQLGMPQPGEPCRLYRNIEGKRFEDVTEAVGLNQPFATMGSNFADFDNDGYLDFYLSTGTPLYSMLVPNRMFKNVEGKRFVDITTSSGTGHLQKGHCVACGDWDRDGNIDMFVQLGGATPGDAFRNALFQNPGHDNDWLTVKLVGKKTNRAAIGARIKLTPEGSPRSIYREVTTGSSFGGNSLQQTIGVGKAKRVTLEIYWPTSGTTQVFRDIPTRQAVRVTEFDKDLERLNWKPIPVPKE